MSSSMLGETKNDSTFPLHGTEIVPFQSPEISTSSRREGGEKETYKLNPYGLAFALCNIEAPKVGTGCPFGFWVRVNPNWVKLCPFGFTNGHTGRQWTPDCRRVGGLNGQKPLSFILLHIIVLLVQDQ